MKKESERKGKRKKRELKGRKCPDKSTTSYAMLDF